jgi:hypothetical protein
VSLRFTNQALHNENVWGSGCIDLWSLDLDISWRRAVNFTLPLLCSLGNGSGAHMTRDWVYSRVDLDDTERWKFLALFGTRTPTFCSPTCSQLLCRLLSSPSQYSWKINCTFLFLWWSGTKSTSVEATYWPIVPAMNDSDDCGAISGMNYWQGKPKYSEETRPIYALSTKNPTRLDSGSNPGRRSGKPANNRVVYGTTFIWT